MIVSTTMCFPSVANASRGVFVRRRLREIHRLTPLHVVAPFPWFPGFRNLESRVGDLERGDPPVTRPRMEYLPGVAKSLDACFYGRALDRALDVIDAAGTARLIDAHFVWPDGVGAWRVARRRNLSFVCTLRGKLVSQIAHRSKRRQIRDMLLDADGLIAVSRSLADLANEVAGRALNVRVIPNGVESSLFRRFDVCEMSAPSPGARDDCGWSPSARYVVSAGHVQALKGFARLLQIWPGVRRRAGDVRLVLVGGDAGEPLYARRLRRAVAALNRADGPSRIVTLTGRLDPQRVATMMNAADLFVLASRSEGWCNAIAEALACGCPVVATDVGGNREIVTDAALGRLVPFADPAALTDAICEGLAMTWDRGRIAAVGGLRGWHDVAAECVEVFEGVLNGNRRELPSHGQAELAHATR